MHNSVWPVAIIGGGASGLMAAAAASQLCPSSVLLLEKEPRVGRKLLATGNGRCNLLNLNAPPERFHGHGATLAAALLSRIPPEMIAARFESYGLHLREESQGRVYPHSGQASAVLDVLRHTCARHGVTIQCGAEVTRIQRDGDAFTLHTASGETHAARRVIVAAGGKAAPSFGANGQSYALLSALGHTITQPTPALSPLKLPVDRVRGLKGIRVRATLTLLSGDTPHGEEEGEALFTEYGISGIAAMQLARRANELLRKKKNVKLSIRLFDPATAHAQATLRASLFAGQPLESFFTGLVHSRIALTLLREAGLSAQEPVTTAAIAPLAQILSGGWQLPVTGILSFEHAQITAGGAHPNEFNPQTLASLLVPNLYACGEALDIDGDCGGYNLLWAWVSGIVAGESAGA